MWTQIIFFAAVALVIIVLLRRAALTKKGITAIAASSMEIGSKISGSVGRGASSVFDGAKQMVEGLVGRRKSRSLHPGTVTSVVTPAEHKFWRDEAAGEKSDLSSHFEEGEILYKAGKTEEAEKFFIKAAANNPGDAKIYARLGLMYLQAKNYSDAIEALKVAVKLDKYNPSRHYNLALSYWGNKDVQKAIASVREAITLDPVTAKYRQLLEQLLNG